jgi:DeoR/GlpR family transcriptional regulator of sugar metabolism
MAKLSKDERLGKLREVIGSQRTLSTSELQESLGVSRMTLFRDLEVLQEEGYVDRLYGSVTLSREQYNLAEASITNIEGKRRIAQYAATLVQEDDTVFFGAGITVLEVAKITAASKLSLTAFTYSFPIAQEVYNKNNIRLIMGGGYYHSETQSFVGSVATKAIEGLSGRIAFFGSNGFDLKSGITSYFIEQAELIKKMMSFSQMSVAVIDSSKFRKVNVHRICGLSEPDLIITDSGIPESAIAEMKAANIPIVVV